MSGLGSRGLLDRGGEPGVGKNRRQTEAEARRTVDQETMGLREWLAKETGSCAHLVGHLYSLRERVEQAFVSPFYCWEDRGIKRFALATAPGREPRSPGCMVHCPQTGSLFLPVLLSHFRLFSILFFIKTLFLNLFPVSLFSLRPAESQFPTDGSQLSPTSGA